MEDSGKSLTELQFTILDGMADDYEDVEQLYLYANRNFAEEEQASIDFPLMLVEGYIIAKYSNNEQLAPLHPMDFSSLHHYRFGATEKGTQYWKAYSAEGSQES